VKRAPDPEEVTVNSSCEEARRPVTAPTTRSDTCVERDIKFEVKIVNSSEIIIRDCQ
jgi:hypothetical protein